MWALRCLRACVVPFAWNRKTKLAQCVVKHENWCLLPCLTHRRLDISVYSSWCCGRQNGVGGFVDGFDTNRQCVASCSVCCHLTVLYQRQEIQKAGEARRR